MYSQMGQAELMLAVVMILYLIILLDPERALLTTNVQNHSSDQRERRQHFIDWKLLIQVKIALICKIHFGMSQPLKQKLCLTSAPRKASRRRCELYLSTAPSREETALRQDMEKQDHVHVPAAQ